MKDECLRFNKWLFTPSLERIMFLLLSKQIYLPVTCTYVYSWNYFHSNAFFYLSSQTPKQDSSMVMSLHRLVHELLRKHANRMTKCPNPECKVQSLGATWYWFYRITWRLFITSKAQITYLKDWMLQTDQAREMIGMKQTNTFSNLWHLSMWSTWNTNAISRMHG